MKRSFKQKIPSSLRTLLWMSIGISLLASIFNKLAAELLSGWSLDHILGLSLSGLNNGFFWQYITYFFVQPDSEGFSFSFILNLFFNAYMLWMVGSALIERTSSKSFLVLSLFSIVISGLFGSMLMYATSSSALLLGSTPALFTMLICWLMLHPNLQLNLFMAIPIKAKTLVLALLAMSLLGALSDGAFLLFAVYIGSAVFGYLYSALVYGARSPFEFTRKLDFFLVTVGKWIKRKFVKNPSNSNIIDINWR